MSKINNQVQAVYNLTPLQQGMLYQKILDDKSTINFLQYTLQLHGRLDENRAQEALRLVAAKHDALRTLILYRKVEKPRQVVLKERNPELRTVDLRQETSQTRKEHFRRLLAEDMARGFDLEHDPLLRMILIRTDDEESAMIWSMHHIIVDGWCFKRLLDDFAAFYQGLATGRTFDDQHAMIQMHNRHQVSYGDYVRWLEAQSRRPHIGKDFLKDTVNPLS